MAYNTWRGSCVFVYVFIALKEEKVQQEEQGRVDMGRKHWVSWLPCILSVRNTSGTEGISSKGILALLGSEFL